MAYQPAQDDCILQRGSTGSIAAIVYSFFDLSGTIIPLADKRVKIVARGGGYKLSKDSQNGGLVIDTVANTVTWSPTQGEVSGAPVSSVPYYVELYFADGSTQRCIEGRLSVSGTV